MKGLLIESPGDVKWETIPEQEKLKENEVKLQVIYGGICGSDIGVFKGKLAHADYPVIPGHEIFGEIIEKGSRVKMGIGQKVVVQPNSYCGECVACVNGHTNICSEKKSLGINEHGGFSEQFTIDEKYVVKVPDQLANERAILIEPLAVAVHALKKANIKTGSTVAIMGCGTEGMLTVAVADYLGANVTAVDINEDKIAKIKLQYPGINTALPQQLLENQFDIVIEAAGAKQSFEQCIDIIKPGGIIIAIGFSQHAEIQVTQMVRKEITIQGSIIYNVPDDFLTSIDYLLDPAFHAEPIISKILSVEQYEIAYEMAASGNYRKILLKF